MRVQTREGDLAADVVGTGRLVVCASGMGDLRSSWRHVVPGLVEAGFRVATVDLRGHGESDTTFSRFGPEDVARDLVDVVRALGGPAVLIGNSASSAAAVKAAADAPDDICGIALVGPVVRGTVPRPMWWLSTALFLPAWGAWAWGKYYRTLFKAGTPPDHEAHVAAVVAALRDPVRRRATRDVGLLSKDACAARAPDVRAPVLAQMEIPEITTRAIVGFLKAVEHTTCHAA
jgi:pimeloyl-ACP methyl ester carboxylesterase